MLKFIKIREFKKLKKFKIRENSNSQSISHSIVQYVRRQMLDGYYLLGTGSTDKDRMMADIKAPCHL